MPRYHLASPHIRKEGMLVQFVLHLSYSTDLTLQSAMKSTRYVLDSNLKREHIIFLGLSQSLRKLRIITRLKIGGKAIMANLQSHISMEDQSNLCTRGKTNSQCSISYNFCKCYFLLSLK